MTYEMSQDAELLDDILSSAPLALDGYPVTAKRLAHWTGLSVKTISDYRTGKLTVPTRVWREMLKHRRDPRIITLFTGELVVEFAFHDQIPDIRGGRSAFNAAIEVVGEFHEQQRYFAEIVRDGRIDETDAEAVDKYNAAYLRHGMVAASLHKAVMQEFNKSVSEG